MLTRRQLVVCSTICFISLTLPEIVYGFEKDEHDRIIEEALFGGSNIGKKRIACNALEAATALCLDQANGNGRSYYRTLSNFGVDPLPEFEQIDFNVFGGTHDQYTHMGWHYDYNSDEFSNIDKGAHPNWNDCWLLRKRILINTVNTVFNFGIIEESRLKFGQIGLPVDGTKCDYFSELLYYLHILGDYQDNIQSNINKSKYQLDLLSIPFTYQSSVNNITNCSDFFIDFKESLTGLFTFSQEDSSYNMLIEDVDRQYGTAQTVGYVHTKEDAEAIRKCILELRLSIKEHLPNLLNNTSFFETMRDN